LRRPPGPPHRQPPWWPEDEPWPPRRWRRRGPLQRGFGCVFGGLFLVVFVAVLGSIVTAIWHTTGIHPALPGLIVLVLLVLAARTFRRTGRTLDELSSAAQRVADGDFAARVEVPGSGAPPLRQLVRGFNAMAERLELDERQRRSLLADVSHELRTPLAVVQGNLEAMLDGVHPADEQHLSAVLDETRVLSRLVDDLRTLALSDTGSLPLHPEPTDVTVLAAEVVASFRPTAEAAGVALTTQTAADLPLLDADPVRVREVISNLVANALRYTPSGGHIAMAVALDAGGGAVRVAVTDTGSGIPADVLPHVFERFTKSADSRGSGLGLAIARNLVLAHGGDIGATSRPGEETTVWFTLPVDPPARPSSAGPRPR
jgi:signal transduction histidine kinase